MSEAPEKIWAEHQTCTVDGSGAVRLLAMDREFSRGTEYTRTDTIPSPDALIRAALEAAASTGYRTCAETRHVTLGQKCDDSIRALAADPEAIARIAKAAEERG